MAQLWRQCRPSAGAAKGTGGGTTMAHCVSAPALLPSGTENQEAGAKISYLIAWRNQSKAMGSSPMAVRCGGHHSRCSVPMALARSNETAPLRTLSSEPSTSIFAKQNGSSSAPSPTASSSRATRTRAARWQRNRAAMMPPGSRSSSQSQSGDPGLPSKTMLMPALS
eukprot:CAMPEP_0183573542 /NCGR_PEP_ID=MMETSP0371-20130417/131253_1 /TAXON_ID=268820 /ORGANISM="Peridinium aciculiferum, Strain PAER-2" /LENGTH=166 /DNA_ID=CAMNT_0025783529 /DNA_START=18 /DNA_END=513 /DNA_ORIENTATION=+